MLTLEHDVQDSYDGGGLLTKSCPTLATPWTVAGQLQAWILKWVAIAFSRDIPDPQIEIMSPTLQADSLLTEPPGKSRVFIFVH